MSIFSSARKAGFTLIELLVIVMILAILTSLALPQYRRSVERARVAEALTMLRAIYDSCERWAWENGYDDCGKAVQSGEVTFNKLDITAKGTFSGGGKVLVTENFTYTLGSIIVAMARKGDYQKARILFNGRIFNCVVQGLSGEAAKACTVWGASTWNE